ncbi:hypothetical protein [Nostoc sp.]
MGSRLFSTEAIDKGIAKVAVIIPAEFSQDIQAHRNTVVQVLIDATDVNNARVIKNSIQAVTIFFSQEQGLVPTTGSITPRIRLWFNPRTKRDCMLYQEYMQ